MNNLIKSPKSKINSKIGVLSNFISYLEEKKIEYCFLGDQEKSIINYESDFDFYININQKKRLVKFIKVFCENHNLKIVNLFQHEFNSFLFVITYENEKNNIEIVHLDFCYEYIRENRRIFEFKNKNIQTIKIENRINAKVLTPKSAFIYYLLKKILKLNINEHELNYLFELSKKKGVLENHELSNYFSDSTINDILFAIKNEDIIFFKGKINLFKNEILDNKRIKLGDIFKIINRILFRFFHPTGIFLIILGCDGVGKTSLINMFIKPISLNHAYLFRKYKYFHFAPFSKYQSKNPKISLPTKEQPYSFIISLIKIIYLYFVFLFGYIFTTKLLLKKSTVVIIDRYFYDILVFPSRYKIKLPSMIIKFFTKIVPKPDLTFIITANNQQIYDRKKEIEFNKIEEIQNKYKSLKKFIGNTFIIDNSKDLYTSDNSMKKIIINFMKSKFDKINF